MILPLLSAAASTSPVGARRGLWGDQQGPRHSLPSLQLQVP